MLAIVALPIAYIRGSGNKVVVVGTTFSTIGNTYVHICFPYRIIYSSPK